jgi:hypothetical protein
VDRIALWQHQESAISCDETSCQTQTASKMKMTAEIPPEIVTPDAVETRLGTL